MSPKHPGHMKWDKIDQTDFRKKEKQNWMPLNKDVHDVMDM